MTIKDTYIVGNIVQTEEELDIYSNYILDTISISE